MKDKDLKFILLSFMMIGLVAMFCMIVLSSCSKDSETTTLKVEIQPIPNREHIIPMCIVHYNDVRDTFQYILTKETGYGFKYVIPSERYYFEYTLDTNHNVRVFKLYENGKLIQTVDKQGETILINK